ncbi:hypothetical protein [Stieleria varia]|uniref:hypothetical protein n=1 Tax=Stieleria varia TaxID=2528005 RepID=UPI0011B45BB3|nr:hypothetical protein [Stieleria varia]
MLTAVWNATVLHLIVSLLALAAAACICCRRAYWFCIVVFAMEFLVWPFGALVALVSFAVFLQPAVIDSLLRGRTEYQQEISSELAEQG